MVSRELYTGRGGKNKYNKPQEREASGSLNDRDFSKKDGAGRYSFNDYTDSPAGDSHSSGKVKPDANVKSILDYIDKIEGCILGFAIGDAIGAPLEFSKSANTVKGYEPSPRKGLKAGQYTDDTQNLEIGLDSIIDNEGNINLEDHAKRLIGWYKSGQARSVGRTTEMAIQNLLVGMDYTQSGINHMNACGSLALSRLIPHSLLSAISRDKYKLSRKEIRSILGITHAHRNVLEMGCLFNYFIQEIVNGKSAQETLDNILLEDEFLNKRIRKKLRKTGDLSLSEIEPAQAIEELGSGGFIEDVVFSSLYGALRGEDFQSAVIISANGRGDSDSRASLTGALCGLDIGASKIPAHLIEGLERNFELRAKAKGIYGLRK